MTDDNPKQLLKPLFWVGSARKDYATFPPEVQDDVGYVLYFAQLGRTHADAKPLKGFGDASVVEVVSSYDGDAFRTVYTVRFENAIYVLHAFKKKSKAGAATPKQEIELVHKRLKVAKAHHIERVRKP